ncbi:MAG: glycoside hydrolase family 18 [Dysgonamonadaceae bacterium]|jgi:chitinase|nr:glycoside hydrolase family 18 [Dysgonamonadaceae bacterium]
MKAIQKFLLAAMAALVLFSCDKDDYIPGQGSGGAGSNNNNEETPEAVAGRVVIAYVTYYGKAIPEAAHLTHINYAFAEPYMSNGVYEGIGLQGKLQDSEDRFRQIVDLKAKYPNLKIGISFTNAKENARGGCFSQLAKSADYRLKFAQDCKAFLEKWKIDGVDLDWEFPGLSWSGDAGAYDRAVDVQNHILLMKQLRESLGSRYFLTYAGYCLDKTAVSGGYQYIDIKAVAPYVDFVNIMTYDLDAGDEGGDHQSALNDPKAYSDCTRAVQTYLNAGMPASKLVLGIPFYGRISFSSNPGAINYNKIITLGAGYKIDNWDENASVPYVTYNGKYYCGYDNPKSIAIKGEWLLAKGMKGMMFWDYDGDDAEGTLRKAVWEATMKK